MICAHLGSNLMMPPCILAGHHTNEVNSTVLYKGESVADLGVGRVGHGGRLCALLGPHAQEVIKYIFNFQINFLILRAAPHSCAN